MSTRISEKGPKAAVSWSSGKDSAYAYYKALQSKEYDIIALLTTVTSSYDRVSMHGVREELLMEQARSIGLPLIKAEISPKSSNEEYEKAMEKATTTLRKMGVEYLIFGDIFLQDVREYRENRLEGTGIKPLFPLWNENTDELAVKIIDSGINAHIVCLDTKKMDEQFGGASFDKNLLDSLPEGIDRCGENGEFHTFVHRAPFFKEDIPIVIGESLEREGFFFTDIYMS